METFIDNCYISFLNLPHRTDRLHHMNRELARVGINAVRHEARLPKDYDFNNPKYQSMMRRTPGALGCQMGQIEIMQKAFDLGKSAFVLEDDLVFATDIKERLDYIGKWINENDPTFDIIWGGATFHNPAFWHKVGKSGMPPDCSAQLGKDFEDTNDARIKRTFGSFCTYAYIVRHESIPKVLALLEKHMSESIGIDWTMIKIQPQLHTYAFVPGSVIQFDNKSDIGFNADGTPAKTMFSGFAKLNGTVENSRYWFQDNINDFDPINFKW